MKILKQLLERAREHMTDDTTDSSSKRLKSALGGISTSKMQAIRDSVDDEIKGAKNPSSNPPPTLSSGASLHSGDMDDLEKAGKIADNFMVGLDHMADVLMLLVMKFGRASTMVRAVFIGLMVGNVLLMLNLFFSWHLSSTQGEFQEAQAELQRQQAHILDRQRSTERVAGEAKVLATAADKTATEVKDSAPSVVVDSKGRPQLILKVQGSEGDATKTVDPKRSTLKNDGKDGTNLQTPLTF